MEKSTLCECVYRKTTKPIERRGESKGVVISVAYGISHSYSEGPGAPPIATSSIYVLLHTECVCIYRRMKSIYVLYGILGVGFHFGLVFHSPPSLNSNR